MTPFTGLCPGSVVTPSTLSVDPLPVSQVVVAVPGKAVRLLAAPRPERFIQVYPDLGVVEGREGRTRGWRSGGRVRQSSPTPRRLGVNRCSSRRSPTEGPPVPVSESRGMCVCDDVSTSYPSRGRHGPHRHTYRTTTVPPSPHRVPHRVPYRPRPRPNTSYTSPFHALYHIPYHHTGSSVHRSTPSSTSRGSTPRLRLVRDRPLPPVSSSFREQEASTSRSFSGRRTRSSSVEREFRRSVS